MTMPGLLAEATRAAGSDLDDVITRSVRLLAQLTQQVAIVQYPTLSRSAVRHLEVVQVAAARLMLVLITDTGRVEQRVVDCPVDTDAGAVAELRTLLNSAFAGVKLTEAGDEVPDLLETAPPHLRGLVATVSATLLETLVEPGEDRLVIGGTANLARGSALDFHGTVSPLLEALEEQVVVLRLISQVDAGTVLVRIGEDGSVDSQPCGGTHVANTGEIGAVHVGKIEKKGRENRRFRLRFGPAPQN